MRFMGFHGNFMVISWIFGKFPWEFSMRIFMGFSMGFPRSFPCEFTGGVMGIPRADFSQVPASASLLSHEEFPFRHDGLPPIFIIYNWFIRGNPIYNHL